jgi:hypothetical protein
LINSFSILYSYFKSLRKASYRFNILISVSSESAIVEIKPVKRLYMKQPRSMRDIQKNFSMLLTPEMSPYPTVIIVVNVKYKAVTYKSQFEESIICCLYIQLLFDSGSIIAIIIQTQVHMCSIIRKYARRNIALTLDGLRYSFPVYFV